MDLYKVNPDPQATAGLQSCTCHPVFVAAHTLAVSSLMKLQQQACIYKLNRMTKAHTCT